MWQEASRKTKETEYVCKTQLKFGVCSEAILKFLQDSNWIQLNCQRSICCRVESGLEEDRERHVEARSKDLQDRGGVKPLSTVQQNGESDSLETITSTRSKPSYLIYLA